MTFDQGHQRRTESTSTDAIDDEVGAEVEVFQQFTQRPADHVDLKGSLRETQLKGQTPARDGIGHREGNEVDDEHHRDHQQHQHQLMFVQIGQLTLLLVGMIGQLVMTTKDGTSNGVESETVADDHNG